MEPHFFRTPGEFRAWLEANHESSAEVFVGYYKKSSGESGITWSESVDQALCFGWIDGVRRSIDDRRYYNRFTPRRKGSNWSRVNIEKVGQLMAAGLMTEPGLRAFEARTSNTSGVYSFEQGEVGLSPEDEALIAANPAAWENWQRFPPSYRKLATWWVLSAKQPATRSRRLQTLIEDSARGVRIKTFRRPGEPS